MKALYKKSRWIHKYFGLALLVFCAWMSLSGILLNHPDWIADISVPGWLVPPQYTPNNWNRSALIEMAWSEDNPGVGYLVGKKGIWRTDDGALSFEPMMSGLPSSAYYRKAYSLLLRENVGELYAGTEGGLYVCDPAEGKWRLVPLGDEHEPVKKVLQTRSEVVALTESDAFVRPHGGHDSAFTKIELQRDSKEPVTVSLVRLFFDLHDGKAWGLPGKLLFDVAGLVIVFLCVTAFYIWFAPWRQKRRIKKGKAQTEPNKRYRSFAKHHNTWGIWFALLLALISFTGIFMRPPLLAVIAHGEIPAWLYPGIDRPGPFDKKIQNALYDEARNEIIIAATDGFWRSSADLKSPFGRMDISAPVFVMGATVFEDDGQNSYLVGSFNGIYREHLNPGEATDLLTGDVAGEVSSVRPADVMVTGYVKTPDGQEFITAHEQGLLPLHDADAGQRFRMPEAMANDRSLPLWNWMFELHNGRIFADLIGNWYILLVPIGSILFFLITITGIIDWFYLKLRRKKVQQA